MPSASAVPGPTQASNPATRRAASVLVAGAGQTDQAGDDTARRM
jgi:hypothetical protein